MLSMHLLQNNILCCCKHLNHEIERELSEVRVDDGVRPYVANCFCSGLNF